MPDDVMLENPTDQVIEPEPSQVDKGLAEIEKALGGDEAAKKTVVTPAKESPKPGEQPPTKVDDKLPVEPAKEKTPEEVLEEQLKGIEETKPPEKPQEPQLSPEQKQILEVFPTPEKAAEVLNLASGYNNFTGAFAGGDFKNVDAMLERWNPEATEAFREYVFDKYVRNGDWVDRWIAEKEGRADENRDVRALKGEVQKLKTQLDSRRSEEATQAQQAHFQGVVNAFVGHVEGLFNQIKATDETDKKIIWSMVNGEVSGNQALKNQILQGNYKAVNAVFKNASRTYYTKNKTAMSSREVKLGQQEQHKPPVQAGVMQELSEKALPDNIKEVPKGQEDNWLDQQLAKLGKGRKK